MFGRVENREKGKQWEERKATLCLVKGIAWKERKFKGVSFPYGPPFLHLLDSTQF